MLRSKKEVDRHVRELLTKLKNEKDRKGRGYNIARLYYNIGEYESARRYLVEFILLRPKSPEAHRLLGQIHEGLKQKDKAIAAYKTSYEIADTQKDLVLKICELYAEVDGDKPMQIYWAEEGQRLFPHHNSVVKLKEILNINNPAMSRDELEKLYLKEIKSSPLSLNLHLNLIKLYKEWAQDDLSKYQEAYNYVVRVETRRPFPHSLEWYESMVDVIQGYENWKKPDKDKKFEELLLCILERCVYLSLSSSCGPALTAVCSLKDCANKFNRFDARLVNATHHFGDDSLFISHIINQYYYHLALILMAIGRTESFVHKDLYIGTLLLHAGGTPKNLKVSSTSSDTEIVKSFSYGLGCYRVSQVGHVLNHLALSNGGYKVFLDRIREVCGSKNMRDDVYNIIFGACSVPSQNSFLLKDSNFMTDLNYVDKKLLLQCDKEVSLTSSNELHELIWLYMQYESESKRNAQIGNNFFNFQLFRGLPFHASANTNAPETLCHLDLVAFIVATTYCHNNSNDNHIESEKGLPSLLVLHLHTPEQGEWWSAASLLCSNSSSKRLNRLRSVLQNGLEVIRQLGNQVMPQQLLIHLARYFSSVVPIARIENNSSMEIYALEERAEHYWNKVLSQCHKSRNISSYGTPSKSRLFELPRSHLTEKEEEEIEEEGKQFLAERHSDLGRTFLDGSIDSISLFGSPPAQVVVKKTMEVARPSPDRFDTQVRLLTEIQQNTIRNVEEHNAALRAQNEALLQTCQTMAAEFKENVAFYKRFIEDKNDGSTQLNPIMDQMSQITNGMKNLQMEVRTLSSEVADLRAMKPSAKVEPPPQSLQATSSASVPESQVPIDMNSPAMQGVYSSYMGYYGQPPLPSSLVAPNPLFNTCQPPFAPPSTLSEQSYISSPSMLKSESNIPSTLFSSGSHYQQAVGSSMGGMGGGSASMKMMQSKSSSSSMGTAPPHAFQINLPPSGSNLSLPPVSQLENSRGSPLFSTEGLLSNVPAPLYSAITTTHSPDKGSAKNLLVSSISSTPSSDTSRTTSISSSMGASSTLFNAIQSPKLPSLNKSLMGLEVSPIKGSNDSTNISSDHYVDDGHDPCPDYKPVIPLPATVEVCTGEEEEKVLFEERAKLFRFADKEWKERGLGPLKILHNQNQGTVRVLMRRDQTHKICCNHLITSSIELTSMKDNEKVWIWAAQDYADEELKTEKFCCRFKTIEIAKRFQQAFYLGRDFVKASEKAGKGNSQSKPEQKPTLQTTTAKPLSEMFKPATGSWTCDTCLVQNQENVSFCVACQIPNPAALSLAASSIVSPKSNVAPAASSSTFKFGFGSAISSASPSPLSFLGSSTKPAGSLFGTPTTEAISMFSTSSSAPNLAFGVSSGSLSLPFGAAAPSSFGLNTTASSSGSTPFGTPANSSISGLNFGTPASASVIGLNFGTPVSSAVTGLSFGLSTSTPISGLSFSSTTSKASSTITTTSSTSGLFGSTTTTTNPSVTSASTGCTITSTPTLESLFSTGPATSVSFGPTSSVTITPVKDGTPTVPSIFKSNSNLTPSAAQGKFSVDMFTFSSDPILSPPSEDTNKAKTAPLGDTKKDSIFSNFSFSTSTKPQESQSFSFLLPATTSSSVSTATSSVASSSVGGPFSSVSSSGSLLSFGSLATTTSDGGIFATKDNAAFQSKPLFGGKSTPQVDSMNDSGNSPPKDDNEDFEPQVDFAPVIPLPDLIDVKTGEEEEEAAFCERAKLFRYDSSLKEWKERGIGEMKLLKNTRSQKFRLLMRRDQTHKVCANHFIAPCMKLSTMANSDKAWVWAANDYADEEMRAEKFAVKFKTKDLAQKFATTFEEAKKIMSSSETLIEEKTLVAPKKEGAPTSLSQMFKPALGSWECSACLVQNKAEDLNCVACSNPKPGKAGKLPKAKNSTTSLSQLFKPAIGSWECSTCLVQNNADVLTCLACSVPKPGSELKGAKPGASFGTGESPNPFLFSYGPSLSTSQTAPPKTEEPKFNFGVPSSTSFSFSAGSTTASLKSEESSKQPFNFTWKPSGAADQSSNGQTTTAGSETTTKAGSETTTNEVDSSEFVFGSPGKYKFSFSGVKPTATIKSPRSRDASTCESEDGVPDEEDEDSLYFEPVVPLPEKVEVVTGEEEEEPLYIHRAKLYRMSSGEFKERGIGDVKLLLNSQTNKVRLLMRREQVHKICLNHYLTATMEFRKKDDKSFIWVATDYSETEPSKETFAIRFKSPEIATSFITALAEAQKKIASGTTIISSPKPKAKSPELSTPSQTAAVPSARFKSHSIFGGDQSSTSPAAFGSSVFGGVTSTRTSTPGSLFSFGDRFAPVTKSKDTPDSSSNSSGEVEFITERKASAELIEKARKLLLPDNFYLYEDASPCPGCIGCTEVDEDLQPVKKSAEPIVTLPSQPKDANGIKTNLFGSSSLSSGSSSNLFSSKASSSPLPSQTSLFGTPKLSSSPLPSQTSLFGTPKLPSSPLPQTSIFGTPKLPSSPLPSQTNFFGNQALETPKTTKFEFKPMDTPQSSSVGIFSGKSLFGSKSGETNSIFGNTNITGATNIFGNKAAAGVSLPSKQPEESQPKDKISTTKPISIFSPNTSAMSFGDLAKHNGENVFGKLKPSDSSAWVNKPLFASKTPDKERTDDDDDHDPHFEPVIPMPELVEVTTGEEGWQELFSERAKLYRYDVPTKQWKERGIGEFKIQFEPSLNKYRLLQRREQVYKLSCNHYLTSTMEMEPMLASDLAWCWVAIDYAEGNQEPMKLAVKFKTREIAQNFKQVFDNCKEKVTDVSENVELSFSFTKLRDEPAADYNENEESDREEDEEDTEEESEEDEDAEEEEETMVLLSEACTLFKKEDEQWKYIGNGELRICYDDEAYGARIIVTSNDDEKLADNLIAIQTTMFTEGDLSVTWKALDELSNPPEPVHLKAQFDSKEDVRNFENAFTEGKEYAENAGIEETDRKEVPKGQLYYGHSLDDEPYVYTHSETTVYSHTETSVYSSVETPNLDTETSSSTSNPLQLDTNTCDPNLALTLDEYFRSLKN